MENDTARIRDVASTEVDAAVSAITEYCALQGFPPFEADGSGGSKRDYRRALIRFCAEQDRARQRQGAEPAPTDERVAGDLIATLSADTRYVARTERKPVGLAAREVASHRLSRWHPAPAVTIDSPPRPVIVTDPDLRLAVAWHGGSTFHVHRWVDDCEYERQPFDVFTRYSELKRDGQAPEPHEVVRFASEWLDAQQAEALT